MYVVKAVLVRLCLALARVHTFGVPETLSCTRSNFITYISCSMTFGIHITEVHTERPSFIFTLTDLRSTPFIKLLFMIDVVHMNEKETQQYPYTWSEFFWGF